MTINLYQNGSGPVASTVTAADGSYSFTNLGPGTYYVQEAVPAGYTQTGGTHAGDYTFTAHSGQSVGNFNFDDFQNISISGTKFNDITGNSFYGDDTWPGGVTINLYLNGEQPPIASTVTAADGSYSFTNLGPGNYSVQEVVPAGSTQTGGNAGYTIIATSGNNSTGNNFDNFTNISITGTKFNDITGNSFSGDDVGQGGVTINLVPQRRIDAGRFDRHGCRRFLQLHESRPRHLHRAGSRSGRLDANRRQRWLHDQRHQRHQLQSATTSTTSRTSRSPARSSTTSPATASRPTTRAWAA